MQWSAGSFISFTYLARYTHCSIVLIAFEGDSPMRYRTWVIVLAFGMCGIGRVTADENEDKAVAAIEKLGGKVTRDNDKPDKPVVGVNLQNKKMTDEDLKELATLTKLTNLNLTGTQVTDVGLKEIAQLTKLTDLNLTLTKVTDAGIKELAPLNSLIKLNLWGTKVTDVGLKEIAQVKGLTELVLHSTKVTDAGP
jgi:internalin A